MSSVGSNFFGVFMMVVALRASKEPELVNPTVDPAVIRVLMTT
jgi:hypothetical protein